MPLLCSTTKIFTIRHQLCHTENVYLSVALHSLLPLNFSFFMCFVMNQRLMASNKFKLDHIFLKKNLFSGHNYIWKIWYKVWINERFYCILSQVDSLLNLQLTTVSLIGALLITLTDKVVQPRVTMLNTIQESKLILKNL